MANASALPIGRISPRKLRIPRPTYVVTVLVGFAVAAGAFVAASVYADRRLEQVARRSRQVSDVAMPCLLQLAAMRRELAHLYYSLHESADGRWVLERLPDAKRHLSDLADARSRYEALPRFPREPPLWESARARLDGVQILSQDILALLEAGATRAAEGRIVDELAPATKAADAALEDLIVLNHAEGSRFAAGAEGALSIARRTTALFDGLGILVTAALALAAYRAIRTRERVVERRVGELEAFASRVAHDVRGPLTPAMFALQSIVRQPGPDGDTRRALAERGLRSLGRLEALVRDLLDFTRAGSRPESGARASLKGVADGIAQDVEAQAAAARVRVVFESLPDCDVACAPGVLASILSNLLTNAIKYMPECWDKREICVCGRETAACARIEVADTGGGLTDDEQARIFEPYVRFDPRQPGLGLGLATVQNLVRSHGGRIGVRSRKGQGAVFWFELPKAR